MDATQEKLEAAKALAKALGHGELFCLSNYAAMDMYRAAIKAAMLQDLEQAAKKADQPRPETPQAHTYQSDWRDYTGYICEDERTAKWVAAWAKRYLDTSGGGDGAPGTYVMKHDGKWLAVLHVYKIGE